jgi:hypothetical protein
MPLAYPLAPDARAALDAETDARTIAEARERAGGPVTLVSEWLRPTPGEAEEMRGRAEAGLSRGFVQIYEDAKGRPVIAVTFWKPGAATPAPAPAKPAKKAAKAAPEDHTDDLYFAKPASRTKKSTRRLADPNQLDLFKTRRED